METDAVPDSNSNNNNNNNDNHYKDCNDDSNKDDGADNYASDSSTRRKRKLSDDDEPSASRLEEDEFLESIQFNEIIEELRARALERRPRRGQLRGFIAERCILKDEDEQRMKSQLGRLYSDTERSCGTSDVSPATTCPPSPVCSASPSDGSQFSSAFHEKKSPGVPTLKSSADNLRVGITALRALHRMRTPIHQQDVSCSLSPQEMGRRLRTLSMVDLSSAPPEPQTEDADEAMDEPDTFMAPDAVLLESDLAPLTPRSERRMKIRQRVLQQRPSFDNDPLVIAMCGLPGCGKSYVAQRIQRYLGWQGITVKIFNSGAYRRQVLGSNQDADFFNHENKRGREQRDEMAKMAMDDLLLFLREHGQVGIFDATNTTRQRRASIVSFYADAGIPLHRILFYESICDDLELIKKTVVEVKMKNEDYSTKDTEKGVADFMARRSNYEKVYEPLSAGRDARLSWIKNRNVGSFVQARNVRGVIPNSVLQFTAQLPTVAPPIFLIEADTWSSRNILGGDKPCSEDGKAFAAKLARWLTQIRALPCMELWTNDASPWEVWHSTKQRAIETVEPMRSLGPEALRIQPWSVLDELNFGEWEGVSPQELSSLPGYDRLVDDPFFNTFPRGESCFQLIQRLEPLFDQLNTLKHPVVIVTHEHVLRCLLAYALHRLPEECVSIDLHENVVMQAHFESTPSKAWLEVYPLADESNLVHSVKKTAPGLGLRDDSHQ